MQGAQMATMLQYIVGVSFSMVVSTCHTVSYCTFEEFHSRMSVKNLSRTASMIVTLTNESYVMSYHEYIEPLFFFFYKVKIIFYKLPSLILRDIKNHIYV